MIKMWIIFGRNKSRTQNNRIFVFVELEKIAFIFLE